jgi:hypothetical protein
VWPGEYFPASEQERHWRRVSNGLFKGGHAMLRVIKGWLTGTLVVTLGLGAFGCSESTDTGKGPPKGGGGGNMMGEKMKEMTKKYGNQGGDQADKDKDKDKDKAENKDVKDKAPGKTKEKDKTGDKNK